MSYVSSHKRPIHTKLASSVSLGSALLAGLIVAPTYAAENNPSDKEVSLSTIEVNANQGAQVNNYLKENLGSAKFTQPIAKTPKTVQIIDKNLFNDQHATTLTEALRNSPGVGTFFVGENGNTTTGDSVYMRGFDASNSIFVDGVRDLGSISRDTFNTEQVEITKGADGSAYGRTAPSGSINMVTKRASLETGTNIGISAGSQDQKRLTLDVNQVLGNSTAVRLNLMGQDSGVPGRDVVTNKRWGIAPSASFGLGTDTRVHLNLMHITQNNTPDGGVLTVGLPGYTSPDSTLFPQLNNAPKVDSNNFYGTTSDYDDVRLDMATLIFEKDLSPTTTFYNTTRVGQTQQDYLLGAFMANSSRLQGNATTALDQLKMGRLVNAKDQQNRIFTNQAGFVQTLHTGGVKHTLSYGVELSREELETKGIASITAPTVNLYRPDHNASYSAQHNGADGKGSTDTAALYLFDTIELSSDWTLSTGLRFDHYRSEFSNSAACVTTGTRGPICSGTNPAGTVQPYVDSDTSGNLVTGQIAALYQLTATGNIYSSYALSAQPPGGDNLQLSTSDSSAANPKFDPQTTHTLEIGTKWNLLDERLLLTAAVYRTQVKDQVEKDPVDNQYYQTGEKQVQGFELSAVGTLTPNWNISTGFSNSKATVEKGVAITSDGSSNLSYNPTQTFTSWTTYRLPFGLVVGGGARYVGGLTRGKDGSVGLPTHTESYWVADAMASYDISKNADLQLNLYNLTDNDYVAAINKSGYRYTPGQPRSGVVSLNVKF